MKFPRIAFIGNESLTASHGTGMMFDRHFSKYPRSKLVDIHFRSAGGSSLFRNILIGRHQLDTVPWNHPAIKLINEVLAGKKSGKSTKSLIYKDWVFNPVKINWDRYGGPPDLIYSTCFSGQSFAFLHHFYRNMPKKVPIIQHFLDFDLTESADMISYFRELSPSMVSVWALTPSIQKVVSGFSPIKPEIVQALHQPIPALYKQEHREFSKNFNSLLIGNIWSGNAYLSLKEIWAGCQKNLRDLAPVKWVGHTRRFDVLKGKGLEYHPKDASLKDYGLVSATHLRKMLRQADLAVVPFTGKIDDDPSYTNFSLPSRMGDYCSAGLPIVVISRNGTSPARFVREYELGIVIDPGQAKVAARQLEKFILDRKWRENCGKNGRELMKRELNLTRYQKTLYPRLEQLAALKVSQT